MATIGPSTTPAAALPLADAVAVAPAEAVAPAGRRPRNWSVRQVLLTILLIGFAALFLYPLVWLLAASLKPASQVFDNALVTIRGNSYRMRQHTELWQTLHANQDPEPSAGRRRRARQEVSTN